MKARTVGEVITAIYCRLSVDDLANMPLLVPNDTSLSKFHEATKGLYSQISNNILENKRLIAIRNFLLPLLMNGQATIAE